MEDEDKVKKREKALKRTFIGMTVYLIFIIPLTYAALSVSSPSIMYHMTRILKRVFLETPFNTRGSQKITFHGIMDKRDILIYLQTVLVNGLHTEYWYNAKPAEPNTILHQNKILGVARLRQVKVRNNSCVVHDSFRDQFATCYDEYSTEAEDFGEYGPKWVYTKADKTGSIEYTGKLATYGGGGFLIYLGMNRKETEKIIKEQIIDSVWLTEGSRCAFIDFTVYNADLNLFCVIKMVFEFPASGGAIPSASFNTIRFINTSKFVLTYKILCLLFIIYYTLDALRDIYFLRWRYIKDVWSWLNIILLCFAYLFLITILSRNTEVERAVAENIDLIKKHKNDIWYANFELAVTKQITYNNMLAILLFLAYIKIFKYFAINKSMAQLNSTVLRCALDVIGFSVMFFIIFFAYAEFGYLLFGSEVEGFSTFGYSMFTLLRTILGDFSYMEMESANKLIAPIYFLTYIFLVFFVLLNMFLAIIIDTYAEVKNVIEMDKDGFKMSAYMQRLLFTLLKKCGCGKWVPKQKKTKTAYNILTEQIRHAQKSSGFTDLETEVFFQSHHINPETGMEAFNFNKFMAELEEKTNLTPSEDVDHIATQYERLVKIEKVVTSLAVKVDTMVKKLDRLDNVRRGGGR